MAELLGCRTCRDIGWPPEGAVCPECKRPGGLPPFAAELERRAKLDELRGLDLRPRFERFESELRALKKISHTPVLLPRWPGWVALAAFALASWNAFSSFR